MDVLALFGWRTCRETPFKNSFSSASLPTRRSRAAMRASYSASTSAAAVSLSSPPASNLATQILIRLRPIPWRLARACSDSPPRNSWTTWRLNSIECVRCLAMGFLLESPVQLADSHLPHLSTPRGALHIIQVAELFDHLARKLRPDHANDGPAQRRVGHMETAHAEYLRAIGIKLENFAVWTGAGNLDPTVAPRLVDDVRQHRAPFEQGIGLVEQERGLQPIDNAIKN